MIRKMAVPFLVVAFSVGIASGNDGKPDLPRAKPKIHRESGRKGSAPNLHLSRPGTGSATSLNSLKNTPPLPRSASENTQSRKEDMEGSREFNVLRQRAPFVPDLTQLSQEPTHGPIDRHHAIDLPQAEK